MSGTTNPDLVGLRVRVDLTDDPYDGNIGVIAEAASSEFYSVRIIGVEELAYYTENELRVVGK